LHENRHTDELCPLYEEREFKDKAPRLLDLRKKGQMRQILFEFKGLRNEMMTKFEGGSKE
jgi:hypothetical protein